MHLSITQRFVLTGVHLDQLQAIPLQPFEVFDGVNTTSVKLCYDPCVFLIERSQYFVLLHPLDQEQLHNPVNQQHEGSFTC